MKQNLTIVTWRDEYALGMSEIDAQHKTLFEIMNRLWDAIVRAAPPAEIGVILDALENYTVMHFREEESFMRNIHYPKMRAHVELHRHFVKRVREERIAALDGRPSSLELLHFLRDWLVSHILIEDKSYAVQFRAEKRSQSVLARFFAKLT